jgi:two-component system response regulator FlrC
MAPVDGMQLLRSMREQRFEQPLVLMTAYGNVPKAVAAVQAGAADYLPKPFEASALLEKVRELLACQCATVSDLVAEDVRSRELIALAERVAGTEASVMISGESGSGKEVLARYLHAHSPRAAGPFVAINCAAIPENMLEAVLFGYEKGAYTGAIKATPGKFEQAQGGTLLLDEISEMDLALQAKLLRVLQEREVERLGGRDVIQLDVRILATTNRRLREEVAAGRFREDLFYRLNVFPLHISPLRERPDDILPLARALLARHDKSGEGRVFSAGAEAQLRQHRWPGNVRELDNVVQRALVLARGREILAADILFEEQSPPSVVVSEAAEPDGSALHNDLRSHEQQMIIDTLEACGGRRKDAAEALGISPRTLRYKLSRMRDLGLRVPGDRGLSL